MRSFAIRAASARGLGVVVALHGADQDQEALADLAHHRAVDADGGLGDALDERPHASSCAQGGLAPGRLTVMAAARVPSVRASRIAASERAATAALDRSPARSERRQHARR